MTLMTTRPGKTIPTVTAQDVATMSSTRFNPLRGLTPERLASYLDMFDAGYLSGLAQLMQKIEERDDILPTVVSKRKKSVARHGYEIIRYGRQTPGPGETLAKWNGFHQNALTEEHAGRAQTQDRALRNTTGVKS